MQREQRDDDAVWQSIVDNYGDRVLDPADDPATEPARAAAPVAESQDRDEPEDPEELDEVAPQDRFVPPTPPPFPRPSPDRLLSWLGVFGAPAVLLFVVVTGLDLPTLIGWFLVGSFVAGFGYLVYTMSSDPREPWDDGAQL